MPPQQLTWTYVSDSGKRYVVGLFHSLREGHLMVYCNQKVVLIDFKVFDTRTYPLFLEDELFKVIVERQGNRFSYGFEIDKKADTPRNKWRRTTEKKHWRQTLLFVAALVVLVAAFTFFFQKFQKPGGPSADEIAELFEYHSTQTEGEVDLLYEADGRPLLRYTFEALGKQQSGQLELPDSKVVAETGWPVQKGDRFQVRYVSDNPRLSQLQLQNPTDDQREAYRKQALKYHLHLHPELTEQHTNCLLDIAYTLHGTKGWAAFRFQETAPAKNPFANTAAYQRLVRSHDFQNAVQENCWE
ncbi:MAG: hypothetical protein GVY26_14240 [Bacteroidetes bacterium]|jgi:hypothetical protein|nr:hypothetical protein [Bacteroidota bacterium]